MPVVFYFLLTWNAFAVVGGKGIWVPSNQEESLIRRTTVRFIMKTGNATKAFCSGIIEGFSNVLTAGHCFNSKNPAAQKALQEGRVFAEIFDPANPIQRRRIRVNHADVEFDADKDLALARLDAAHGITQSVPLAYGGCDPGSEVYAAGFGFDESGKASSIPRIAKYAIGEAAEGEKHVFAKFITDIHGASAAGAANLDKFLVAQRTKGQACFGDSGGPVFCKSKGILSLAAITSGLTRSLPKDETFTLTAEYCRGRDILIASRISENRALLDKWLNPAPASSDPATTD